MSERGPEYDRALAEFRSLLEYQPPGSLLREGQLSRLADLIGKYPAEAAAFLDEVDNDPQ